MIFEVTERPDTPAEKRTKAAWIDMGVKYMDAKKNKPSLTAKQFAEDNKLNYETFRRAMNKYKDQIKRYYSAVNPNKTKEQWIELGVAYLDAKDKGVSFDRFADKYKLNPETAGRSFRKFKQEIVDARALRNALDSKKKLSSKEKYQLMLRDFRSQVKVRSADSVTRNEKKSADWFTTTLKKNVRGYKVSRPSAGKLYAFIYDAKHKATLPYWDMYPLIVYLGESIRHPGLMVGLNLHYIPPKARQEFLEELLKFASTDRITNKTMLKIDWGKVRGMRGADLLIKTYIPANIKGSMVEIKPADWYNVIYLPTQKFISGPESKGYNVRSVWSKY
ncbi:DNA end protector protein [Aeromonas phage Ahp1_CNU-2021]|nr:DNA end protector protein [Aeromonas phage Ahp1_CNU-2021]